jgi:hypothetical protein
VVGELVLRLTLGSMTLRKGRGRLCCPGPSLIMRPAPAAGS